jgi:hypothetical protein
LLSLATVIGPLDQTERRVRLATVPAGEEVWAELALASIPDFAPGDRVLVAKDAGMRHYVIGVLQAGPAPRRRERVLARDGSSALCVGDGQDEKLQIQDPQGRLLFEYRPGSGKAVVNVPEGDLRFQAPRGTIDLVSGRALRLSAGTQLQITSLGEVSLNAGKGHRGEGASLRLAPDGAALTAKRLGLRAKLGDLAVDKLRYRGGRIDAKVSKARLVLGQMECFADRVVTRAQSLYQKVEHLHHTSAGRVRTLVEGTFDVKSRRLRLKSEEVAKIDGSQIHLG